VIELVMMLDFLLVDMLDDKWEVLSELKLELLLAQRLELIHPIVFFHLVMQVGEVFPPFPLYLYLIMFPMSSVVYTTRR
jgi:hypothetical protein